MSHAGDDPKAQGLRAIDELTETAGGAVAPRPTLPARRVRLLARPADGAAAGAEGRLNDQQLEGLDRQMLCEQILSEGYVQAFVDFFYLTHRPAADNGNLPPGEVPGEIQLPAREMVFMKDRLVAAEAGRRRGDIMAVYRSYEALAKHFQTIGDPKTGIYFHERCLETSRLAADPAGEMRANCNLGRAYLDMNEVATAIDFQEKHAQLARAAGLADDLKAANAQLLEAYARSAEEQERLGDYAAALPRWHKSLECAKAAQDRRGEGRAAHRLGAAHVATGDALRGVNYLEDFEGISRAEDDLEAQGHAFAALAGAYAALENDEQSLLYLNRYLEVARSTHDLPAQGGACVALGALHTRRREYAKAKETLTRNFEISTQVAAKGSRSNSGGGGANAASGAAATAVAVAAPLAGSAGDVSVDMARALLGVALGHDMLAGYMKAVTGDLRGLLAWKSDRVRPGSAPPPE